MKKIFTSKWFWIALILVVLAVVYYRSKKANLPITGAGGNKPVTDPVEQANEVGIVMDTDPGITKA